MTTKQAQHTPEQHEMALRNSISEHSNLVTNLL